MGRADRAVESTDFIWSLARGPSENSNELWTLEESSVKVKLFTRVEFNHFSKDLQCGMGPMTLMNCKRFGNPVLSNWRRTRYGETDSISILWDTASKRWSIWYKDCKRFNFDVSGQNRSFVAISTLCMACSHGGFFTTTRRWKELVSFYRNVMLSPERV